jgi:hypothetical protein
MYSAFGTINWPGLPMIFQRWPVVNQKRLLKGLRINLSESISESISLNKKFFKLRGLK